MTVPAASNSAALAVRNGDNLETTTHTVKSIELPDLTIQEGCFLVAGIAFVGALLWTLIVACK